MTTPKPPTPGSQAAREQGCKCPVMDNAHGRGIPLNGKTEFWISLSCPLHAGQVEEGAA